MRIYFICLSLQNNFYKFIIEKNEEETVKIHHRTGYSRELATAQNNIIPIDKPFIVIAEKRCTLQRRCSIHV